MSRKFVGTVARIMDSSKSMFWFPSRMELADEQYQLLELQIMRKQAKAESSSPTPTHSSSPVSTHVSPPKSNPDLNSYSPKPQDTHQQPSKKSSLIPKFN